MNEVHPVVTDAYLHYVDIWVLTFLFLVPSPHTGPPRPGWLVGGEVVFGQR